MAAPPWFKRTIIVPHTEFEIEAVQIVQEALHCEVTGRMDAATRSHIRGAQRLFGIRINGVIDLATAELIERLRGFKTEE